MDRRGQHEETIGVGTNSRLLAETESIRLCAHHVSRWQIEVFVQLKRKERKKIGAGREVLISLDWVRDKSLMQLKKLNTDLFPVRYNNKYYAGTLASGEFTKLGCKFVGLNGALGRFDVLVYNGRFSIPRLISNAS
ncbi:hypothetical protein HHK36_017903 [Tetracentron sinense]|uniref:Uncharacterized protein n=1 Tax=Tetracentron sinense TaxID=13715 RepID=A0A835D9U4_TETSI|nr:hypothetical protein HHK36_017903 [Tetracentron sinense]